MSIFSSFKKRLKDLKKRAWWKKVDFDLDTKWLIDKFNKGYCEVTGLKFDTSKKPYVNPYYPSIDRINSKKGYTKDNCQMVCHMYNTAKCEFSKEVFTYWAKAFVKKYEEDNNEKL